MRNILKTSLIIIVFSFTVIACRKKEINDGETPSATNNRNELTKDSMFLYAKQVYLWNTALPTYSAFNPRKYTSFSTNIDNLNSELFAITRYGINPLTAKPYEYNPDYPTETKYSYIDDLVANGTLSYINSQKSSVGLDGKANDFGFGGLTANNDPNNKYNYVVYIKYSSPSSPLANAGIGRGDYINEINGTKIGTNFSAEESFLNNTLFSETSSSIKIAGIKKNGVAFNVTLNRTQYNSSAILKDTVLTVGSKKIGYLAFARFSTSDNAEAALNTVFSKFASQSVENLVIDLRYNGGGYVSTAEHLLNLIAPTSINGKKMFAETFNALMQANKATILKNQPARDQNGNIIYQNGKIVTYADESFSEANNTFYFAKEGALNNVSKVVFITTGGTASASELVINSLKPYLDVKTVGATSYGKPVGFFPIRIDKFDIYMSMFSSTNANGEGNYFAGITPDATKADDLTHDFGDPSEKSLAGALTYISSGTLTNNSISSLKVESTNSATNVIKDLGQESQFKGMIYTPKGH